MKNKLILILILGFLSCKDDEMDRALSPTAPINDPFNKTTATAIKSGMFMNSAHTVTGTATLYESDGKYYITLEPFMTDNGPDLKIYLSEDAKASKYLKLGELKSTNGKQTYDVPSGTNVSSYKYLLVWCEQFSVNFGYAELN